MCPSSRGLRGVLAVAVLAACLGACATTGRQGSGNLPAPLYGMVYDGRNQPVLGAQVTVVGHKASATTDINGRFVLDDMEAGSYELVIAAPAHETLSCPVLFDDAKQVVYAKLTSLQDVLDAAAEQLKARRLDEAALSLERALRLDRADPVALYLAALHRYLAKDGEAAMGLLERLRALGIPYPAMELLEADVRERLLADRPAAAAALRRYLDSRWDPAIERRLEALEGAATDGE